MDRMRISANYPEIERKLVAGEELTEQEILLLRGEEFRYEEIEEKNEVN